VGRQAVLSCYRHSSHSPANATPSLEECPHRNAELRSARHCHSPMGCPSLAETGTNPSTFGSAWRQQVGLFAVAFARAIVLRAFFVRRLCVNCHSMVRRTDVAFNRRNLRRFLLPRLGPSKMAGFFTSHPGIRASVSPQERSKGPYGLAINLIAKDLAPRNTRVCRLSGSLAGICFKRSA
jgi:hypothetical protein